jgi:hypothetical protein
MIGTMVKTSPLLKKNSYANQKFLDTLPGNFAVWAATDEASFLHGRYCWAGWDVQELKEALSKECRLESQDFLKVGVIGMKIE